MSGNKWWDVITSFISASGISGKILGSIQDMAIVVVSDLENVTGMNGANKRKLAYDRIVDKAKKEGIEVISHVVYASIENALMSIRS